MQLRPRLQPGGDIESVTVMQRTSSLGSRRPRERFWIWKMFAAVLNSTPMKRKILHKFYTNEKLSIWARIALNVSSLSPECSNKQEAPLWLSLWPSLSTGSPASTLWEPLRASRMSLCLPATNRRAGIEQSVAGRPQVISWPLHPPWSSKSSAPCRQLRLHWSRGLPLEQIGEAKISEWNTA